MGEGGETGAMNDHNINPETSASPSPVSQTEEEEERLEEKEADVNTGPASKAANKLNS